MYQAVVATVLQLAALWPGPGRVLALHHGGHQPVARPPAEVVHQPRHGHSSQDVNIIESFSLKLKP